MARIKQHLMDNRGDTNMEHLMIIVIAFVAGALLVAAVWSALQSGYSNGLENNIQDYLD
jgi:hypothetical protein